MAFVSEDERYRNLRAYSKNDGKRPELPSFDEWKRHAFAFTGERSDSSSEQGIHSTFAHLSCNLAKSTYEKCGVVLSIWEGDALERLSVLEGVKVEAVISRPPPIPFNNSLTQNHERGLCQASGPLRGRASMRLRPVRRSHIGTRDLTIQWISGASLTEASHIN